MKKIRSILMICIFALLIVARSNVYAAEYYGDFQYEESEDTVVIYAYNGADKEVSIPAYIKEKPVTEIKDYAFLLCNSVEKIIVPSTVKNIGANAFSGASNLKEVVLASEDTKVEENVETEEQGKQEETEAGNRDNPETEDGTLDNNKPNYEVSVDPNVDTADDEIAGIDEGIEDESENNQDNIEENTNTTSKTGENESTIGKDNEKSGRIILWTIVGGVLVIGAGIGFVIWKKKRK